METDRPTWGPDRTQAHAPGARPLTSELARGPWAQLAGTTLGRYRIEGEVGRGGMGRVLRARDIKNEGAVVALKLLLQGAESVPTRLGRADFELQIRAGDGWATSGAAPPPLGHVRHIVMADVRTHDLIESLQGRAAGLHHTLSPGCP